MNRLPPTTILHGVGNWVRTSYVLTSNPSYENPERSHGVTIYKDGLGASVYMSGGTEVYNDNTEQGGSQRTIRYTTTAELDTPDWEYRSRYRGLTATIGLGVNNSVYNYVQYFYSPSIADEYRRVVIAIAYPESRDWADSGWYGILLSRHCLWMNEARHDDITVAWLNGGAVDAGGNLLTWYTLHDVDEISAVNVSIEPYRSGNYLQLYVYREGQPKRLEGTTQYPARSAVVDQCPLITGEHYYEFNFGDGVSLPVTVEGGIAWTVGDMDAWYYPYLQGAKPVHNVVSIGQATRYPATTHRNDSETIFTESEAGAIRLKAGVSYTVVDGSYIIIGRLPQAGDWGAFDWEDPSIDWGDNS